MEKADLEFLACQTERLVNEVGELRDGMRVLMALVERLEIRDVQNRCERWTERLEGRDQPEVP